MVSGVKERVRPTKPLFLPALTSAQGFRIIPKAGRHSSPAGIPMDIAAVWHDTTEKVKDRVVHPTLWRALETAFP